MSYCFVLLAVMLSTTCGLQAIEFSNSVPVTTNMVFFLMGKWRDYPQAQFGSDEQIVYVMAATGTNYVRYLAFPFAQAFDFKLLDSDGREVQKTDRGLANSKPARAPVSMSDVDKLKSQVVRFEPRLLFHASDMFMITNKGIYELEVRIRISVPMTNGMPDSVAMTDPYKWLSNTHYGLVASDPVRVKIVKE